MEFFGCPESKCNISVFIVIGAGCVFFLMLLTILILSICLCRVCKKLKKRKLTEVPTEADLHYAELQNLPDSGRGQCDGGTCSAAPPTVLNSDYATVAELQGPPTEDGSCTHEQKVDDGAGDGAREDQSFVGLE